MPLPYEDDQRERKRLLDEIEKKSKEENGLRQDQFAKQEQVRVLQFEIKALEKRRKELETEIMQLDNQYSSLDGPNPKVGRSFNQRALQQTESKMLGLRIDPASAGNAGGREDNRAEIDKLMNDTNRKLSSLERQYKQAVQECDDDMDCVDDVHSMFEVDMQKVVDRVSKELKQLGVTQFVNELDIPEEFDITE